MAWGFESPGGHRRKPRRDRPRGCIPRAPAHLGSMEILSGLHPRAFAKADPTPDALFYATPRFVTHIDAGAIDAVTRLYASVLPANGIVLDLMSSFVSHLPADIAYGTVIGHGMNRQELAANPRLDRFFVQDLNDDPTLPLDDASVDGACLCVGVLYLLRPVAVFAALRRVLRTGAPVVVSFSNRCFPTKATAIWRATDDDAHTALVSLLLERAGFGAIETGAHLPPRGGDPLRWVIGRAGAPADALAVSA